MKWATAYLETPSAAPRSSSLKTTTDAFLRAAALLRKAPTTIENYEVALAHLSTFSTRPLDTTDWAAYFEHLAERDYAASTMYQRRSIFLAVLRWAKLPTEPLEAVALPRVTATEPATLPHGAVLALVDECAPPLRLAIAACYATGARIGELLALRWEDFDERKCVVRISRQLAKRSTAFAPPKGRRARTVLVLPFLWELERPQTGLVFGSIVRRGRASHLLSASPAGRYGWHIFRHSYARTFLECPGTDLTMLQEMLGHASARTTEIYRHFTDETAIRLARPMLYEPIAAQISAQARATRLRITP